MAKSLQEQLLGAGLVDKQRAQKIRTEQRKKKKQQPKGHQSPDEVKLLAQQAREEKAARDRELNLQQKHHAEKKAIAAQIKQLIEMNRIECTSPTSQFQFTDQNKVKQIGVTDILRQQLIQRRLAIVLLEQKYALVPLKVADKIAERDPSFIIFVSDDHKQEVLDDDPYAEFQVPDDLMW